MTDNVHATVLSRTETASLVALAAQSVPPLWPLESAIAVNPLAGLEHLPFEDAVRTAACLFSCRPTLRLVQWRDLVRAGRINPRALREAAVERLGIDAAFQTLASKASALDLLMARLLDLDETAADIHAGSPLSAADEFVAKWCAAFFDQGNAVLAMPGRDQGLYRSVLNLAALDPAFRDLSQGRHHAILASVSADPLTAIAEGLQVLGVPPERQLAWLRERIARLPGWAGHLRWREAHADADFSHAPATVADLLALLVLVERATGGQRKDKPAMPEMSPVLAAHINLDSPAELPEAAQAAFYDIAAMSPMEMSLIFIHAAELTYRQRLVPALQDAMSRPTQPSHRPAAQLVFCIDVRSEPFRRALEAQGDYQTFGYAGFFGLPIAVHSPTSSLRRRQLPVLISPQHDLLSSPLPGNEPAAALLLEADQRAQASKAVFSDLKQGAATGFATAEAAGPIAALVMAARTFLPRFAGRLGRALEGRLNSVLVPSVAEHTANCKVFSLDQKATYARALFKLTGMSWHTARIVLLTGHGGSAVNNPYAAALDCGACGGHAGGPNARLLAEILNDPAVRGRLAETGEIIPEDTVFVAAQHNTTTDEVELFDLHLVPASHAREMQALADDLAIAGAANRARRAILLDRSPESLLEGASHWGEVRPEWGLAGNAAFIVGSRELTRGIDLEGRAFLHSYDWKADPDGEALATILTAPMVVAQWINCQYLFSTLDNERLGAGDKTTQNPVGRIGVVQGNGGDLRIGLPRQSLFADDGTPFHIPQRLLTVVHAPFERVDRLISSHDVLSRLFGNGWVSLVVLDPVIGLALHWRPDRDVRRPAALNPNGKHREAA